jgi:hypothetical protein
MTQDAMIKSVLRATGARSLNELHSATSRADLLDQITGSLKPYNTPAELHRASADLDIFGKLTREAKQFHSLGALAETAKSSALASTIGELSKSYTESIRAETHNPALATLFEAAKPCTVSAGADYLDQLRKISSGLGEQQDRWLDALESPRVEIEMPAFDPPDFGPSMMEIMQEQDKQHEQRHLEQLAVVQRMAAASETSAQAAKDSERSAQESLDLARKSLRNSRIANWIAFGALVLTAFAAYVAMSAT